MIGFNGYTFVSMRDHDVRHRDGRRMNQVRYCVQVGSIRRLAKLLDDTEYGVKSHASKVLNNEMIEALSAHPPETVLIKTLDPGGTIDGQTGWVKL